MEKKKHQFNKKNRKAFEQFLRNHVSNILACGGLTHFNFRWLEAKDLKNGDALNIHVTHKYYEFRISYDNEYAAECWSLKHYDELVKSLCHEVAHIPCSEYDCKLVFESSDDHRSYYEERLTEITSRWLFNLYKRYMVEEGINIKTGK